MSDNNNTPATTPAVEIVAADSGPVFTDAELAAIDTIASGGTVDGIDVHKLDATIISGIKSNAAKADAAMVDLAGFMGAALKLRTWTRVIDPATDNLFASEAAFTAWTLAKYPMLATVVRRELLSVIDGITDANGKPLSGAKLGGLLGISRQTVSDERKIIDGADSDSDTGDSGAERGPQTGGQTASTPAAVKRHVTGFASAGTRVRDDLQGMTPEQVLLVASEARDTLSATLAFAQLQGIELPEWAAAFVKSTAALQGTAKPKLRSGAEGTVASGPVLAGAPVDPTAAAVTPATAAARRNGKRASA